MCLGTGALYRKGQANATSFDPCANSGSGVDDPARAIALVCAAAVLGEYRVKCADISDQHSNLHLPRWGEIEAAQSDWLICGYDSLEI